MLHAQIQSQKNYRLKAGDNLLRYLSFNYDRRESLLESYSKSEIEQLTAEKENLFTFESGNISFEQQLERLRGGKQLWRLFLLIALLFLATEVVLLRFMK